ncbi:hypothetical protein RDI58_007907 [Solanum bulbocastanum]|uniref:DUF4283 domain-containing protein n=1 Tax=Solanum bulbocastanum TaxID=147425 RepID=A0AAN8YI49_SOLBU
MIGDTSVLEKDLSSRCLSTQEIETPTLNEVRRWACNTWKVAGSLNVFAMNDGMFLFQLPSKKITEHNTFKQIGEQCSGYIETRGNVSKKPSALGKNKGERRREVDSTGDRSGQWRYGVHNLDMGESSSHF